jgi:serine/threonine protein kinase
MAEIDEIEQFRWYYKNHFKRTFAYFSGNLQERQTFLRASQDLNDLVIVKKIRIRDNNNMNNFKKILREVYFLACSKKNLYFVEIIDVFLSEDNDHVFIILKAEGADLKDHIDNEFDYNKNIPGFARSLIFQVVSGLKILHEKNLSHNDIKPSNIVVSNSAKVKICDMGSTEKVYEISNGGTNGYLSPQALLGQLRTKEDDMWSVGVVFLELLKKKAGVFVIKNKGQQEILKDLLQNYYIIRLNVAQRNTDINDDVIEYINIGNYASFEYELKLDSDLFSNINNEDKELIKKLLEINPIRRLKADELLNLPMFSSLDFIDSQLNYSNTDYDRYLDGIIPDRNIFLQYLEEIKEKFIGKELFK